MVRAFVTIAEYIARPGNTKQPLLHALSGAKALSGTLSGPAFPGDGATCARSPLGFWRDDGQSPSALAELRTQKHHLMVGIIKNTI